MVRIIMKLRYKINRSLKKVWERLNGLDFTKGVSLKELGFTEEDSNFYSASYDLDLVNALNYLDIQSSDAILDFGAGKGSALVAMSKYKFKQVDGVELSEPLCEIARKNMEKLRIKNSSIFHWDAKEFVDLDMYSHFYFFNPFPEIVLKPVIQNIMESYNRQPRKITIIYYLPAFAKVIEENGFFKEFGKFKPQRYQMKFYANEFND